MGDWHRTVYDDSNKYTTSQDTPVIPTGTFNEELFGQGKAVFDKVVAIGAPTYSIQDKSKLPPALKTYTTNDLKAANHYSMYMDKDLTYKPKELSLDLIYWRSDVGNAITNELARRPDRGGRKSRLNVQRRRTQRNGRGRKHRKLRKLTTRRR